MQKFILAFIFIAFSILTAIALYHHGYLGIIESNFQTFGGAQVLVDLVIALSLFLVWMWKDARKTGRQPMVWLILTLLTGSIGPLLYLLTRKELNSK